MGQPFLACERVNLGAQSFRSLSQSLCRDVLFLFFFPVSPTDFVCRADNLNRKKKRSKKKAG